MKLRYTPAARTDLREIREYISEMLKSPIAADRIITGILEDCSI